MSGQVQVYLRSLGIAIVLIMVGWAGVIGLQTGWSLDNDSFALQDTFRSIIDGTYRPSRTSGYPLYEFVGANVWRAGGYQAVASLSLAFSLAALVILIVPARAHRSWIGFVAWTSLALTPTVLTNSSAVMETSLLFLAASTLALLLTASTIWNPWGVVLLTLIGFILVATRPDAILLVTATAVALLTCAGVTKGKRRLAASALAVGAVTAIVWIVSLTGRWPLSADALPTESALRRILRGGIGLATATNPVGALALILLLALLTVTAVTLMRSGHAAVLREGNPAPLNAPMFILVWTLATIALYLLRFLALSDEVEYLLPLLIVLAVSAHGLWRIRRSLGVMSLVTLLAAASTSLITVSLLARSDPWQSTPSVQLSLQSGGWLQDINAREAAGIRSSTGYQSFLRQSLRSFREPIDEQTAALMPRDSWHFIRNAGYRAYYDNVEAIVSCDALVTETLIPGWRVSQPAGDYPDIARFKRNDPMTCSVVATISDDIVTPIGDGITPITREPFMR